MGDEGVFIHYDYSDDDEEKPDHKIEAKEEKEEDVDKKLAEMSEDMAKIKIIEANIEKFKKGEIDEEELNLQNSKLDLIMKKYLSEEEKLEHRTVGPAQYEEAADEDNQNSMIKSFISDKLEDAEEIDSTAFDEDIIPAIKKLNVLKLFTMETEVEVKLAAKV